MAADNRPADVVIVGAGVVGLGIAWRACQAGLAVTVCDPEPGRGASWAAAGMLAPVTEVHYGEEALLRLNLASNERWPAFAEELEQAADRRIGYRQCGTVLVARDRDDLEALTDLQAFQQRLGLPVQRLRSDELRELEPCLAPRTRGGLLVPGDHQVDNRALVEALLVAVERAGACLRTDEVAELVTDAATGAVQGVRLRTGQQLPAGQVVLAAGWRCATLPGLPPNAVPVRPVKGQLLHLRRPEDPAVAPLAERNVRGLEVYVVPRADGRVVVGATVEERGADTTITAGAVLDLLRGAWELLPGIGAYELVETTSGLRPTAPDNAPLIGPAGPDGLVVATGHFRNGILLTPATADAVAELLASGSAPALIEAFDPRRFAPAPA